MLLKGSWLTVSRSFIVFAGKCLALSPLFKPIKKPKSASHHPHNNISERLKYSQGPCLT
jgi:hypothetical protein